MAVPGVADVRGRGLLLASSSPTAGTRRRSTPSCSPTGLIVNAVTATALRLAPPITVTDSEIDEAVALIVASLARALADSGVTA